MLLTGKSMQSRTIRRNRTSGYQHRAGRDESFSQPLARRCGSLPLCLHCRFRLFFAAPTLAAIMRRRWVPGRRGWATAVQSLSWVHPAANNDTEPANHSANARLLNPRLRRGSMGEGVSRCLRDISSSGPRARVRRADAPRAALVGGVPFQHRRVICRIDGAGADAIDISFAAGPDCSVSRGAG